MHPSSAAPTSASSLTSGKDYIYDYSASTPSHVSPAPSAPPVNYSNYSSPTQLAGSQGNTPTNSQHDRPRLLYDPRPSRALGPSPLVRSTSSSISPLSPQFDNLVNFAPAERAFPPVEELRDPRGTASPTNKAKKGRVPPPVNTLVAAALPGPECNIKIIQDDSKVARYHVGDHVQVRRWHASKSTYGPWKPATVHDRVHPIDNATGRKQRLYVVAFGDRISRDMYDPGLGEITRYNANEIYATPDPQYDHYGIVFALVNASIAKDRKAGILVPGQRTREEPWKVRLLVGPRAGYDYQATFAIPYTRHDAARAQANGLELFGDGTPEFLRSHGYYGPLGDI
ncbi:hypothetical protein PTI98_008465 [Pleurotus ostreatus]|nr:hypothetical protein PTI98_008465 [Pleurotus ostreatus]